jgi:hypothetical protein
MIPLIIVMTLLSFIQVAWLPFNIIFLIIIIRSYIVDEQENLYLAFGFGLLLSILSGQTLGLLSLEYLIFVEMVQILRRFEFSSHPLIILPIAGGALILNQALNVLLFQSSFDMKAFIISLIFILPVFFAVKFWEERFIPASDIKLKLGR